MGHMELLIYSYNTEHFVSANLFPNQTKKQSKCFKCQQDIFIYKSLIRFRSYLRILKRNQEREPKQTGC